MPSFNEFSTNQQIKGVMFKETKQIGPKKKKRDEESILLSEMMKLQTKLQTSYSDSLKTELERIKFKLSKIAGIKTRGTIVRSRARWYLGTSMVRGIVNIFRI